MRCQVIAIGYELIEGTLLDSRRTLRGNCSIRVRGRILRISSPGKYEDE
jgi:hypothetical protein